MKIEVIEIGASNLMKIMEDKSIYGITYGGVYDRFYMRPAKEIALEDILSDKTTFVRISK